MTRARPTYIRGRGLYTCRMLSIARRVLNSPNGSGLSVGETALLVRVGFRRLVQTGSEVSGGCVSEMPAYFDLCVCFVEDPGTVDKGACICLSFRHHERCSACMRGEKKKFGKPQCVYREWKQSATHTHTNTHTLPCCRTSTQLGKLLLQLCTNKM